MGDSLYFSFSVLSELSQLLSGIPLSKFEGYFGGVFLSSLLLGCWIELPPYSDGLEAPHLPTPLTSVPAACLRPATMRLFLHRFEEILVFKSLPPHFL